ncbi:MAG: phosphate ABC transporter permease subunit PstC [Chloroflexi bacterium]|nr:phosphate ABC transporter permease subunit PstC [Chloroflexota bacterium]MCC6891911.1 phosphate ABC transporter permease subunit PstC [Anaerolineae bacterium]
MEARLDVRRKSDLLAAALPARQQATRTQAPSLNRKPRIGESVIQALLMFCGAVSVVTTVAIVIILGREALPFFSTGAATLGVSIPEFLGKFFTGTQWQPQGALFGVLPLVLATVITSLIAMLVAVPLGLAAAIYLSEYASPNVRATLKPILEILAGVPTVVYGFFALQTVSPALRDMLGRDIVQFQNMLSAGLIMGFMILPTISSISEDALSAVPRSLREASYGLSANRFETTIKVVVPAALSGIVAATILGISRAVGETMIVALAAGSGPNLDFNPLHAAETMTGHIVRISTGELSYNSIDYNSLFAIGLLLFVITLGLNLISRAITNRYREVY